MEKIYRVQMNSKGMPNFSTAVEIADRPSGEWIMNNLDGTFKVWDCSECGIHMEGRWSYCPHCGARMKGADDE